MWSQRIVQWTFIVSILVSIVALQDRRVSASKVQLPKDCGRSSAKADAGLTVMGGQHVPSYVNLLVPNRIFGKPKKHCGGTILSDSLILTSAKCITHATYLNDEVIVLKASKFTLINPDSAIGRDIPGIAVKLCPSTRHHDIYSYASHDIAIVKTFLPLNFSDTIQPACLPGEKEYLWPSSENGLHVIGLLDNQIHGHHEGPLSKFPAIVDITANYTRHAVIEKDCPQSIFHPSIACFETKINPEVETRPICKCKYSQGYANERKMTDSNTKSDVFL